LTVAILRIFERYYGKVELEEEEIYERWKGAIMMMGRMVEVKAGEETIRGKAIRVDRNGALIIEDPRGEERTILSGDVSLRI
jgi:biotin-(acetyl-CoA carboxylase) ligase